MPKTAYASLREDLSDRPLNAAVQGTLKNLVEAGHAPQEVVTAAFETATELAVDASGIDATSAFLLAVAGKVAQASPEMHRLIGLHIQALAALVEKMPVQEDETRH